MFEQAQILIFERATGGKFVGGEWPIARRRDMVLCSRRLSRRLRFLVCCGVWRSSFCVQERRQIKALIEQITNDKHVIWTEKSLGASDRAFPAILRERLQIRGASKSGKMTIGESEISVEVRANNPMLQDP